METSLSYPVGIFKAPDTITQAHLVKWIKTIEGFPASIERLVQGLSSDQLQWRYRPEGWTIHQVIHHCSDSHMNALTRFKWALTEDNPVIKPYEEALWAELPDTRDLPIEIPLSLLKALHVRWTHLLRRLTPKELKRTFIHPADQSTLTLAENIGKYDWHCRHHFSHIMQAIDAAGQYQ